MRRLQRKFSTLWTVCFFVLAASGFLGAADNSVPAEPYQATLLKLSDKNPQVRRQGADALGQLRNPAAAQPLLGLLKDPAPPVRAAAVDALGLLRHQPAAQAVAKLL